MPAKTRTAGPLMDVKPMGSDASTGLVAGLPNLVDAVNSCVEKMSWLTDTDTATVALALHYAYLIETAEDKPKILGWHGPHLLNTLRALGMTPADRKNIGIEETVGGRLAELRTLRGGNTKVVDAAEG